MPSASALNLTCIPSSGAGTGPKSSMPAAPGLCTCEAQRRRCTLRAHWHAPHQPVKLIPRIVAHGGAAVLASAAEWARRDEAAATRPPMDGTSTSTRWPPRDHASPHRGVVPLRDVRLGEARAVAALRPQRPRGGQTLPPAGDGRVEGGAVAPAIGVEAAGA
eukprot:CAMPEP_0204593516 /NCGR_PEP_ID=MMETSP0661-20131031/51555_1 /ASSEMBLY_ACC=CAM_ASM_000606 /TAXON_ID=109239 /ORGANISM="Alexandrium margalefi, Strain AMGDE01CS-322" /LENGTH=161 /DNA_ID=CAMNT_0051603833 /DNA_START=79 /DNA_END=561 /DNA_ORIENTATION=-